MNSPITVGIVGFGLIGKTHAQALRDVDGATLTSIVSTRPRDQLVSDAPGIGDVAVYATPEAMYSAGTPDVVAICTPPGMHVKHVCSAFEHGAHVLAEKPPAASVAELSELMSLATAVKREFAVASQQRMEPHLAHLARVVSEGTLGALVLGEVRLHWHRPQTYYDSAPWRKTDPHGGSLANQGWHAVDLLTWFLGPATQVTAQTATLGHDIDAEDTTVATVRFRGGGLGSIVTSTATPPGEPTEIRLFFEHGSVRIHDTEIVEWAARGNVPPPPSPSVTVSGASDPAAIGAVGHHKLWQNLVDALRAGSRPAVTADDALNTLALVESIYLADETETTIASEVETP